VSVLSLVVSSLKGTVRVSLQPGAASADTSAQSITGSLRRHLPFEDRSAVFLAAEVHRTMPAI